MELADLKPFVRDLMGAMESDLGTRLDWVAVDHFNTEHPHTHIVLRGKDDLGNRRTAYSLRHTYICFRLMEGADIYQIAKNCRTSVEMIEKFYASHIKTALDTKAINVTRERPRPAKEQRKPLRRGQRRRDAERQSQPD